MVFSLMALLCFLFAGTAEAQYRRHEAWNANYQLGLDTLKNDGKDRYVRVVFVADTATMKLFDNSLDKVKAAVQFMTRRAHNFYQYVKLHFIIAGVHRWVGDDSRAFDMAVLDGYHERQMATFAKHDLLILLRQEPTWDPLSKGYADGEARIVPEADSCKKPGRLWMVLADKIYGAGNKSMDWTWPEYVRAPLMVHETSHIFGFPHSYDPKEWARRVQCNIGACDNTFTKGIKFDQGDGITGTREVGTGCVALPYYFKDHPDCSAQELVSRLGQPRNNCFLTKPALLSASQQIPVCGNGVVENGEKCDCGPAPQLCLDKSCDYSTCQTKA